MLRDTLGDFMNTRHTLPYLHCGIAVQFHLWKSASITLAYTVNSSLAYWFRSMKSPLKPGGSLNFHFNGIVALFPDGNIPLFGTKTSMLAEHKVATIGSKILLVSH